MDELGNAMNQLKQQGQAKLEEDFQPLLMRLENLRKKAENPQKT